MDVIVIGGGAAGMVAAIKALNNGHKVTILEQKEKLGKKLLATGNGRCNLTNRILAECPWEEYLFDAADYDKVKNIFKSFSYEDTIRFFDSLGLMVGYEGDYVYPLSKQASSVYEVLTYKLRDLGADVKTDTYVTNISKENDKFMIKTSGNTFKADKVICAFGSKAMPKLGGADKGYYILNKLGHKMKDIAPGLVQLKCDDKMLKDLAGVRTDALLSLFDIKREVYKERGQLQFTDYGLSGIVAMNLSNYLYNISNEAYVYVDLLADFEDKELTEILIERKNSFKFRNTNELLTGMLPNKVSYVILKKLNIDNKLINDLSDDEILNISSLIKHMKFKITGTNSYEDAQICMGGISLSEVNECMESNHIKGLYIVGETLNVHGRCGGFNLQWAFTTGAIAGELR